MAKKLLVVLDPGHYPNYNRGAVAGYYEGDKMYDLSLYQRDALQQYGIHVILTRARDCDMELYSRGQVAVINGVGFENVVFISNHTNACNGSAVGALAIRSLYLPDSAELGQKLVEAIADVMRLGTGVTYSRGVTTRKGNYGDYYGVIRGSVSGAKSNATASKGVVQYSYIIEHGFHDNVKECTFLNNQNNLKKIAEAEARVIAEYFGMTKIKTPTKTNELYRVRKSWADSKNQIGAYSNLESAKNKAIQNPGYNVYNSDGECVFKSGGTNTVVAEKMTISDVQKWLNANYNTGLKVDGIYGQLTKTALIKAWQTANGLKSDGIFGKNSKAKAKAVNINVGNLGVNVAIWQGLLICNGYDPNGFDGIFGEGCKTATVKYQSTNGLTADGIVGVNTWTKAFN